jgi:hypothetical protein
MSRTPGGWIAKELKIEDRVAWFDVMPAAGGQYRGPIAYVHPAEQIGGITLEEAKANAELIAAAPVMFDALEKIAGEAPWKPPNASPSVAWPPNWSDDLRDTVNDMILDAFREGFARALWESGQIADEALKTEQA